jgi:DNA-binding MarR family transcriptional regulator
LIIAELRTHQEASVKSAASSRAIRGGLGLRGDDIGYLLKQLGTAFRRHMDNDLRHCELDLSMAHMAALFTLLEEPGLAGAQLARRTMISPQAMNGVLRRLEREGLIVRHQHPDNRRTDCWNLTKAGSSRLARARKIGDKVLGRMLAGFSTDEQDMLRQLIGRCIGALESPRV